MWSINWILDEVEVGITEEELNQVKNLPDVVLVNQVKKEHSKEKAMINPNQNDFDLKGGKLVLKY